MGKILVAVDGSGNAEQALQQAMVLARTENSSLLLTAVIPPYAGDLRIEGEAGVLKEMRAPYEKALQRAKEQVLAAGMKPVGFLGEGEPYEVIAALAQEQGADLIVLGKKGGYLLDLIPIGTVAARVIGLSETDVLVVPEGCILDVTRILLAYDGSADARKAAEKALTLGARYGSEVTVVTVDDTPWEGFALAGNLLEKMHRKTESIQQQVARLAEEKGVRKLELVVKSGKPFHQVCEMAREKRSGLIMLGCRGLGTFRKLLMGSVAERVIGCGVSPVWVAKT